MKDIQVYARTHYVWLSLAEIVAEVKSAIPTSEKLSIFAFESIWIAPVEFLRLTQCTATYILVIAPETVVRFLSVLLGDDNICYAINNTKLSKLKEKIKCFILHRNNIQRREETKKKARVVITYSEYRILMLYIRGNSVSNIASRLGLSVKRVYNMKKYAMRKMGLFSDLALISSWMLIEHLLYNVPLLMDNGIACLSGNKPKNDYVTGSRGVLTQPAQLKERYRVIAIF